MAQQRSLWAVAAWGIDLPIGTALINVLGSFVLGAFPAWAAAQPAPHPHLRLLVATGFCGSFTTFSTFSYETVTLLAGGRYIAAIVNVVGSVVLGVLAVILGIGVVRLLLP